MPAQGSSEYTLEHVEGAEGAVVDAQLKNIVSRTAEVAIPFGRVVVRGTNPGQVKLPTVLGDLSDVVGISTRVQNRAATKDASGNDVLQYEIGDEVNILDFGEIWMIPEDDVTANALAFVRAVAAGAEESGRVRSDADGTDAANLGDWFKFDEDGTAGNPVRVRFRKPA